MPADLRDTLQASLGATYTLERELGGGGMSRVFLATETALGRRVVVKVLPPELAGEVSAERFKREIRLAARLRHPHIVPVHAAGDSGGLLYYTMPFVEGESLRARLARDGRLPLGDAIRILRDVADALAYAHEQGVVHRDIKPENVLLEHGHAVVTDFGVAKALEAATQGGAGSSATLTTAGLAIGTLAYMAPEQALGDPSTDHRADLYALGVVAYEVFAGAAPFGGRTPQALVAAHITEPPAPIIDRRPDVPPALAGLVMRLLAKQPDARPPSAGDVLRELDAVPGAGASTARAPSRARRLALIAAAFLAATGAAAGAWRLRDHQRRATPAPAAKMLAVLPFKNLGPADEQYFADGVTEEITTRLASVQGLGVISRTSADQYRNTSKPLKQVGRELGADYVLEGSVRWAKSPDGRGRVRVTPQLIQVSDDRHLWADRLDADVADVFRVQGQIAERVAGALDVALRPPEQRAVTATPTDNLEAWELYLRAQDLRLKANDAGSGRRAVELYERAVALDPAFALAYAKLSYAHKSLWEDGIDRTPERLARARAAAERALRLAPELPDAHVALGLYFLAVPPHPLTDSAAAEFRVARRLQPSNAVVLVNLAQLLVNQGDFDGALALMRKAAALDPRSTYVQQNFASVYFMRRDYRPAMDQIGRAIAANPEALELYVERVWYAFGLGGDTALTRRLVREAVARFGVPKVLGPLARSGLLTHALDTADLKALDPAAAEVFAGDRWGYYSWKDQLYHRLGQRALRRTYADSTRLVVEPLVRAQPDDDKLRMQLAVIYARLGREREALREAEPVLARARGRPAVEQADIRAAAAVVYAELGKQDAAINELEYVLSAPSWVSVPWLRVDPTWDPLRSNARFQRLVARR